MKVKSLLSLIALATLCVSNAWGDVTYSLNTTTKTLTFTGTGDMDDYTDPDGSDSPRRPSTWVFNVQTVVIEEGVESIGEWVFAGLTNLKYVHIPTSVKTIKERAFQGCTVMEKIYYAGTPNQWAKINFMITESGNKTYVYCHPFNASTASNRSFYFYDKDTENRDILFTPGITEIKPYAFYKANRITNIYLPGTVNTIGAHAFDCSITRLYSNKSIAAENTYESAITWQTSSTYLYLRADATDSYNTTPWYNTSSGTSTGAKTLGYGDYADTRISCPWKNTRYLHIVHGYIDDIEWTLDEDGTLTLEGHGDITKTFNTTNNSENVIPWFRLRQFVHKVVIKGDSYGDITDISNALEFSDAIDEIIIAQTTIPDADAISTSYSFKKSSDKINVHADITSEEDEKWESAPWNNSAFNISYTTTFCAEPTGLEPETPSSIGATSATFTWTDERADTWKYLCLPASYGAPYDEDWDDATPIYSSKTATVTGLTAGTNYVFYLKADCGSSESEYILYAFTTECSTIAHAALPWSENFDALTSGANAPCWAQIVSGDASVEVTYEQYYSSPQSLRLTGGTADNTAIAIFPEFVDDIKTLTLSFRYRASISSNYGTPELGYISNINNAATFVKVQDLEQTNWTQITNFIVPANTPDGARFAIRYTNNINGTTGYTDIDNVTVDAIPECSQPTNVAVSSITNAGATISWDANDMTAWVLQVSEGDDEHWGEDINAATNSKALIGLDANTLYYVRVKADCGAFGDSDWSTAVSFRTECDAIDVDASTPWEENFNAMSADIVPECWNNSASTATPYWDASYYIWGTYNAGSGNKMLRMSNASVDGGIALINTPAFAIPSDGKEYEFAFDYANHASSDLIVKMSVDGSDFGVVNTYHNTGSNSVNPGELTSETISLYGHNGSTVKLQFYTTPAAGYSSADGAMFVDNISVHKVPTCFQPTALAASSITDNSAHLTWTAGASETSWKLQYRINGGEWSEEITVNTTAAKDLESLSANTTYEVRVKAWCNIDDYSEYSEVAEFTTLCAAESMPFSESFGITTSLPTCWEASSNNWSGDYQSTNGFARLRTGSSGTASLCTPPVDLNANAILRFKWKNANGITIDLYISTDRGETKTLITDELSNVQADWTTKQYNLSTYTGEEAQFYFIATFSTQNQYAYLDDVEVSPMEIFEDVSSATNNESRLAALNGQIVNVTINRPLLLNGDYCTLTLPFDLSAEQIADENCPLHGFTIKQMESCEDNAGAVNIYLNEVSEIEAGKAYFVRYAGTPSNDRLTPLIFRNVTISASTPVSESAVDGLTAHGVFNPYALVADDATTLFLSSNNTLYYPSANGTMNGFRAYIKVGDALSAPIRRGAPIRIVEKENTATGLDQITNDKSPMTNKILRDGQIIIIRDGKEYDIFGRSVNQ